MNSGKSDGDAAARELYLGLTEYVWGCRGLVMAQGIPDPWRGELAACLLRVDLICRWLDAREGFYVAWNSL